MCLSIRDSIKAKHYDWACFQAQQAAEKALKSKYLEVYKTIRKIHDLTFFGKELHLPDKVLNWCSELNKVYVETRYPSDEKIPAQKFSEKDAIYFLQLAEEILEWLAKKL